MNICSSLEWTMLQSLQLSVLKRWDGMGRLWSIQPSGLQTSNPPGCVSVHCLVGLDCNESGSFRRQFRFFILIHQLTVTCRHLHTIKEIIGKMQTNWMLRFNCWFFTNCFIGSLFIALHRLPLWILYKMTKFITDCDVCTVHTPNPNSNTKGENSLSSSQLFCFNIWSVLTSFDPSRCYLRCNQTCILAGEAFWLFFIRKTRKSWNKE